MAAMFAAVFSINAQDNDKPAEGQRPRHPIVAALDANKDGEIDSTEISNASAALRKLDLDGDGKISRRELRPAGAGKGKKDGDRPKRNKKQQNN